MLNNHLFGSLQNKETQRAKILELWDKKHMGFCCGCGRRAELGGEKHGEAERFWLWNKCPCGSYTGAEIRFQNQKRGTHKNERYKRRNRRLAIQLKHQAGTSIVGIMDKDLVDYATAITQFFGIDGESWH